MKNGKYSAAVASASWLTDAAYSLRVHTVFPHFPNLAWKQNLSPSALVDLIRASLETKSHTHSIATKKESGFSHDRGIKENLDGALPNYGVSPDSTDKVTRISTDVKEDFGKDAGISILII